MLKKDHSRYYHHYLMSALILLGGLPGCHSATPPSRNSRSLDPTQPSPLSALAPTRQILAATVSRQLSDTTFTFLFQDHQNNITLTTNGVAQVLGRGSFSPTGEEKSLAGYTDPYGFTGQERDPSTGLAHFEHRYLDPTTGRWASPDPLFGISTTANVSSFGESTTAYAYVSNQLMNKTDPTGLGGKAKYLQRKAARAAAKKGAGSSSSPSNTKSSTKKSKGSISTQLYNAKIKVVGAKGRLNDANAKYKAVSSSSNKATKLKRQASYNAAEQQFQQLHASLTPKPLSVKRNATPSQPQFKSLLTGRNVAPRKKPIRSLLTRNRL